jgi:hypothetical protein
LGITLIAGLFQVLTTATPAGAAPVEAWSTTAAGWNRSSSPNIADIDGNGINDVVVGHQDGWLRVFKDGTSAQVPGWPARAIVSGSTPTAIDSSPTVADLDKDGGRDIVVGVGSTWVENQPGGLVVFNSNGTTRCTWMGLDNMKVWGMGLQPDGYPEGVYSTPAVGDVDGDGFPDIVFGGWDAYIHVLNRNCQEVVPKFFNDDTVWGSPSLFDVDNDGRMEIFIGGDSHAGPSEYWEGGTMRSLDYRDGRLVERWKQHPAEVLTSSAAIGDIDGDGRMDVVVGTGFYYLQFYGSRPDAYKVFAWHADDGSPVAGWPQSTGGSTFASPSLADLTGDGIPEVIQSSRDHKVWAWRGNGTRLWSVDPASKSGEASMEIWGSPVVGDITGDGKPEVIVGTGWGMFVLDGATGARVGSALDALWSHESAPALGNFGPNGWRLFTTAFNTPNHTTRYAAYNVAAPGKTPEWPMWRNNKLRTGTEMLPPGVCRKSTNPPAAPSALSGKGYWVLGRDGGVFSFDANFYGSLPGIGVRTPARQLEPTKSGGGYWVLGSDGGVFSFGDARFFGSMGGQRLNGPVIGMTRTVSGNGYWLLGSDGGIFSFGDARFFGSMGGQKLNGPVIGMAATPTGNGYWLLGSDGGIFSFGDARFFGSMGGKPLAAPVISMSPSPTGGYWLLGGDGGVFSFGPAFYGSIPGTGLCGRPAGVQLRSTNTGKGYWIVSTDGGVWSFGDAAYHGAYPTSAIDLAIRR